MFLFYGKYLFPNLICGLFILASDGPKHKWSTSAFTKLIQLLSELLPFHYNVIVQCTIHRALGVLQMRFYELHLGCSGRLFYYRVFLHFSATHLMIICHWRDRIKCIKVETCFPISGSEGNPFWNTLWSICQYHSQWVPLSNWPTCHREEQDDQKGKEERLIIFKSSRTEILSYSLKRKLSVPFFIHCSNDFS